MTSKKKMTAGRDVGDQGDPSREKIGAPAVVICRMSSMMYLRLESLQKQTNIWISEW